MDKQTLQQVYLDVLKGEGCIPKIDKEGDIFFKYQGDNYWIEIDAGDLEYFRLGLMGNWHCETEAEKLKLYKAASKTNAEMKLSKTCILDGETVLVTIEALMDQPSELKKHIGRMLVIIQGTLDIFRENMNEPGEKPSE